MVVPTKIKNKFEKNNGNKGFWPNSQKNKNNEKLSESSKRGWGASNHKENVDKKSTHYYNCEKWGHLVNIFWYKKEKVAGKDKESEEANLAHKESNDFETMMLMAAILDDHMDSKT